MILFKKNEIHFHFIFYILIFSLKKKKSLISNDVSLQIIYSLTKKFYNIINRYISNVSDII